MAEQKHPTQDDLDNYSRQLNPEHDAYWRSRGESGRPDVPRPTETRTTK